MKQAGLKVIDAEAFSGKSVAIVGPAANVEAELAAYGQDDFEVIIRLNKGLEIALQADGLWGPRTNVLFHNLKEEDAERSSGRLENSSLAQAGLRYLVFPHASPDKWHESVEVAAKRFSKNGQVTFCIPPLDLYADVREELSGLTPTTGYIAISTFLSLPLRKLGIFGFSFFSTAYIAGYASSHVANEAPLEWAKSTGWHDPELEAALIAKKLAAHREVDNSFPILLGESIRDRLKSEGLQW